MAPDPPAAHGPSVADGGLGDRAGLLTPTTVRELLDRHELAPRRADGQNFVVDPNTVAKIVRDAGVRPVDRILEVGPGLGSLTLALAEAGGEVIAVEVDAGFVRVLDEVLDGLDNVRVVHADALEADWNELVDGRSCRLVANLPYSVATALVLRALDSRVVTDLFVMVQREVGQRWAARPGDSAYSATSIKIALSAEVELVADVPRSVFYPVPDVDSVTARLTRRPETPPRGERDRVVQLVEAAFRQRRKMLRNSLQALADRDTVIAACREADIDPRRRPETLAPADFRRLAEQLALSSSAAGTAAISRTTRDSV